MPFDFRIAGPDEKRTRRHQRDQQVRIDGQVVGRQRTGVFEKIAGEPVIFGGRSQIFHLLAEDAAEQLGTTSSGRADQADRKPLIVGHGHERRLAKTRKPHDAHAPGVDGGVGLEVIQRPAGTPGPGAQHAPVVGTARPTPIREPDDPLGQSRAVIGLVAGRIQLGVAPAPRQHLLLPGTLTGRRRGRPHAFRPDKAEVQDHRHRPVGLGRRDQRHVDVYLDGRVGAVVHVAYQLPDNHRDRILHRTGDAGHFPAHRRHVGRHAAVDLTVERLDDFRATHLPPFPGRGNAPAVEGDQRIGQGIGWDPGFVGVGFLRRRAGPQPVDTEQLQHALMVGPGCPGDGRPPGRVRTLGRDVRGNAQPEQQNNDRNSGTHQTAPMAERFSSVDTSLTAQPHAAENLQEGLDFLRSF